MLSYVIQDHLPREGPPTSINKQDNAPTDLPTGQNLNRAIFSIKSLSSGAGEMAEKLRVLAAHAKALGSIHKTHSSLQTLITPEDLALFPWALGMYVVHRNICRQNTHTHEIQKQKQTKQTKLGTVVYTIHHPGTWKDEIRQEDQEFDVSLHYGV